jgi:solute carrier family 25 phosphate transporter 3
MSSTATILAPETYKGSFLSQFPIASVSEKFEGIAPKPSPTGVDLYARFAIAGAVCCSVTHGALTPVDVVKTRIQLEPEVYNKVRDAAAPARSSCFFVMLNNCFDDLFGTPGRSVCCI